MNFDTSKRPVGVLARTLMAGILLLLIPETASAQFSQTDGPVNLSADHSQIASDGTSGREMMYLDGRVEVLQSGRRLRCDKAVIIQESKAAGDSGKEVVQIEATGNVFYVSEDQTVRGDYAIYTKADDTLKITGTVILTRGKNVATGNLLIDKVHSGLMTITSDPNSENHGRVTAVLYTDQSESASANVKSKLNK